MDTVYKGDYVFALDIGTRTVIGVVCEKEGNFLKVIAQSIYEHNSRSMIDGQIHDIEGVSMVVTKVKNELEEKVGFALKEVAIAAAGRTLKTKLVHAEQDLGDEIDIDSTAVSGIELMGVSEAGRQVEEEIGRGMDQFYCVGYSVVSYYLNGFSITSLSNHKGRYIGADVLATFLPQSVVNSLYKVLDICGLVPLSLTLEPIAAIEAVVPENIRLLNLVLIDIGAGTSDIAITRRGSIIAYGMVPVAGDEITEAIADRYLVDFNTAESIKKNTAKKKKITFKDITGTKVSLLREELLPIIEENAENIARQISGEILNFNGEPPKAVFCVGGGSQTPYITDAISGELKIEKSRVAVKKRDSVLNLVSCDKTLDGPEGITVIGIAMIAFKKIGHDFTNVYVNDKEYRLFNSGSLMVCDVLGLIGYNPSSLIGRSGKSIRFTLNGEKKRAAGESAVPPEIYVNDKLSSLESDVKKGDYIKIKDAQNGRDASPVVGDYLNGLGAVEFILNGREIVIEPLCTINEQPVSRPERIREGDNVNISLDRSVRYAAYVNDIELGGRVIYANGKIVPSGYMIQDGDNIRIEDDIKKENEGKLLNENIVKEFTGRDEISVIANGKRITMTGSKHIFVDVFNHINFDLSKPKGSIRLLLNGKEADYTAPLKDGDAIEVCWEGEEAAK